VPKRAHTLALFLLVSIFALPAIAQANGSGIRLRSNVSKADNVAIRVSLGGFPRERCVPQIAKDGRSEPGEPVTTSKNGGAVWSWLVPGNIGHGQWRFSVLCTGGRRAHTGHIGFWAAGGIGKSAQGLWIPNTMHAESVDQPRAEEGNGGGGASLYPFGQCTWWVAKHRPDLPFFPERSGDAMNWAKSAAAQGFPVGTVPLVGSVAVFQPRKYGAGPFGHVAMVVAVLGRTIRISEADKNADGGHSTRTISSRGLQFIYRKGNPDPSLYVNLTSPADGTRVGGTATVTAESNAPAVRFAAYSYTNPADPNSGQWQTLGEDTTPGDGFSAIWDTTQTPNQGGTGAATVAVRAVVVNREGKPTGARSELKVGVANSRTSGGQTYFPYYVNGTCQEGECGLPIWSGAGFLGFLPLGKKEDGDEVDLVCQSYGQMLTSKFGGTSRVWDKLTGGGWVSDFFVDTPERGVLSPPIPTCP
jgi:surface antigen